MKGLEEKDQVFEMDWEPILQENNAGIEQLLPIMLVMRKHCTVLCTTWSFLSACHPQVATLAYCSSAERYEVFNVLRV